MKDGKEIGKTISETRHHTAQLTRDDIMEIIERNLSLAHEDGGDGSIIIQLKLCGKSIGKALRLGIDWKHDHGHGGGSYVNGITLR